MPESSALATNLLQTLVGSEAIFLVVVAAIVGPQIWKRWKAMQASDSDGTIGPASIFQISSASRPIDFIAGIGSDRPARVIGGQMQLRATVGLRLLMAAYLALTVTVLVKIGFFRVAELDGWKLWVAPAAIVAVVFWVLRDVIDAFTRDVRYDQDVLIVTRLLVDMRQFRWASLQRVRDDGNFKLILFFKPGGKAKVLKHSAGIDEFKAFAVAQIQRNRANA